MWTKEDIEVTTTSITADKGSINIDQFTFNDPELIHVAITMFSSYWFAITWYKTKIDNKAEIETKALVTISEFLSPMNLPKKPDIIDAINGRNIIESSILTLSTYLYAEL